MDNTIIVRATPTIVIAVHYDQDGRNISGYADVAAAGDHYGRMPLPHILTGVAFLHTGKDIRITRMELVDERVDTRIDLPGETRSPVTFMTVRFTANQTSPLGGSA